MLLFLAAVATTGQLEPNIFMAHVNYSILFIRLMHTAFVIIYYYYYYCAALVTSNN